MPYQNFTPFSNFAPGANAAPDKIVISRRFTDNLGIGVTVDPDIRLDLHKSGEAPVILTFSLAGPNVIDRKVTGAGTYYFVQADTAAFGGKPIEAKWYVKVGGKNYDPYPVVSHYQYPSTSAVILLAVEVADWLKGQLGYPLNAVELTDNHLSDIVDDALELYNRYIPKVKFGEIQLIAGQTRYPITDFGRGVIDVQFIRKEGTPLISDPLFGREYPRGQQLDFDQYVLGTSMFKSLLRVTGQDPIWRWEPSDPAAIHVNAHNQSYKVSYAYVVSRRMEEINPSHHNIFRHISLAKAKIVLGRVRSKFGGDIQAPTGTVKMDGAPLIEEGTNALKELELNLSMMMPPVPPVRY